MPRYRLIRWLLAAGFPLSAAACFVIADSPTPPPPTKRIVELPTKSVVANSTPTPPAPPTTPKAVDNPTVEAGLVKWHKTLDEAQTAAKKSHKPVLLFQMMGYLDKQFC